MGVKQIADGYFCVQVFERNIESEYRVLWFYENEPIVMQRHKSDSAWQSNTGAHPENVSEYVGSNLADIVGSKSARQVHDLFTACDTPFLAIDIYVDKNGQMGILEFQMEFAYKNVPEDLLYNRINSAVNKMISHKRNQL